MCMCEQWWLHCTSQWRQWVPLSEHVYCGHCVQNEQVEQQICKKLCDKLEHSSAETIWMIQKLSAMGNWWLVALSRQCTYSCIMSPAVFWQNIKSGDSVPLQPRFGTLWLLAFPKTRINFEREDNSDHWWYDRTADGDWDNCVRSKGTHLEGDWGVIVLCSMLLVSYIFFKKCLFYHITWLETFWTNLT